MKTIGHIATLLLLMTGVTTQGATNEPTARFGKIQPGDLMIVNWTTENWGSYSCFRYRFTYPENAMNLHVIIDKGRPIGKELGTLALSAADIKGLDEMVDHYMGFKTNWVDNMDDFDQWFEVSWYRKKFIIHKSRLMNDTNPENKSAMTLQLLLDRLKKDKMKANKTNPFRLNVKGHDER
jgi:hypothetical protein